MRSFENDYSEGALPEILEALIKTNLEQSPGYGTDSYCAAAGNTIRGLIGNESADIHFLSGGTLVNLCFISSALRPHEAAIAAESGHISVHETGAIEATGHKVIELPSSDGKLYPDQIKELCENYWADPTHEHMAKPKLLYISQPTECGTLYSLEELKELYALCEEKKLYLYVDGARLGCALVSDKFGGSIEDLSKACDAFTIGGTKLGALFGEALVIMNDALKPEFRWMMKQRGGMMAKGRLLGVQFLELLKDGLYFDVGRHENALALRLREAFLEKGYEPVYDSYTNQQFPLVPLAHVEKLSEKFDFSRMNIVGGTHQVLRFCTSWATSSEDIDALIEFLKTL